MAKVTITFEDTDTETVNVNITFNPVVKTDADCTPAQHMAFVALEALKSNDEMDVEVLGSEVDG